MADEILYVVLDHGIDGRAKPTIAFVSEHRDSAEYWINQKGQWSGCYTLTTQVHDSEKVRGGIMLTKIQHYYLRRDGW